MSITRGIVTLLALVFVIGAGASAQGYKIKVTINGTSSDTMYLAYHYGEKQYLRDTIISDEKGTGVFQGDTALPGGIYLVVMQDKTWFEVIIGEEQEFSLTTDKENVLEKMQVKGNKENVVFYDYQQKMIKWQTENAELQKILKKDPNNQEAKDKVKKVDEAVREYRAKMVKEYPDYLLTKILQLMADPDIPDFPRDEEGNVLDSAFQYYWLKDHFWDAMDWEDERLLRTPVFHARLKRYIKKMTVQSPDSVKKEADRMLEMAEKNKEIFKYTLITIFNWYVNSKVMGMDAVYVHLAQNYYMTKRVDWVDHESKFYKDLIDRIEKLDKTQIGKPMINFKLQTEKDEDVILSEIKSDWTVLFFYDPGCGHCKKQLPNMKKNYENFKDKGVTFMGICTKREEKEFKEGVEKFKLEWINLWDKETRTDFRNWYDIYSTPVLYILDKDKVIRYKRISPEQVQDILEHELDYKVPEEDRIIFDDALPEDKKKEEEEH